jgi:hypothetical protein
MVLRWSQRRSVWVTTVCVAAVALLALVLDHRAHVLRALPYLLLLACPLMHLWHGDHRNRADCAAAGHGQSRNSVSPGDARQGGHS